jgi:hypothetical protein
VLYGALGTGIDALAAFDAGVDASGHGLPFYQVIDVHRTYIDAILQTLAQFLVHLDRKSL